MGERLNILFLMTDQHRWDALGCAGGWVNTPHLDRLAHGGVRFTNCFTTSPDCVPARVSLATGLYPHNTGVWANVRYTLPADAPTWMNAVRAAGYRTSLFGKAHFHPHEGDLRGREPLLRAYGFDEVDEATGPRASARCLTHMTARWHERGLWDHYRDDLAERFATRPHLVRPSPLPLGDYYDVYVGQQAVGYLRGYDRPEPWFCWVSFPGPHEPWDAPEPYASLYDPAHMPPPTPPVFGPIDRPRGHLDRLLASEAVPFGPGEVGRLRANYAGSVTLIDDQIGQILAAVADRGEADRTAVVFASDHGEMNGDHGLLYKRNFLGPAVRVPLIIRAPGAAGGVCHAPVELIDVGPTIVELAGGVLGHQQFGRSLGPSLRDPARALRADVLSELLGEVMLTDGRWKVALNPDGDAYLLFDLAADPAETHNLAGRPEHAGVETELRLAVLRRLCQTQIILSGGRLSPGRV
jgi:choline-sulfatase